MTAMSAPVPFAAAMSRTGHFGAWRAATSVPAMIGSLLLLLVAFGWMGQWEGLVVWRGSPQGPRCSRGSASGQP